MSVSASRRPGLLVPGQLRRLQRPGVQIAVLPGILAWGLLCAIPFTQLDLQLCAMPARGTEAAFRQAFYAQMAGFRPTLAVVEWGLMAVAMMLPLVFCEIDYVRARTYRRERRRVTAAFVGGFLAVWILAGSAAIPLTLTARAALQSLSPVLDSPAVPLLLAALWMLSDTRRRALARGHYRPSFAAEGAPAVWGALAFGLRHARYCVTSCLPLMLALQVAGGGLTGMALLAVLILDERRSHRPDPRGPAIVLATYGFLIALN